MHPRPKRGRRCNAAQTGHIRRLKRRSPAPPGGNLARAPRHNQPSRAGRTTTEGSRNFLDRLWPRALWCAHATIQVIRCWSLLPEDFRNAILRSLFPL